MAKFVSNYPGTLILPPVDGKEVAVTLGDEIGLTKDEAQHAAVAEWIKDGWLVEAGKVKVAAPSEDTATLKAELSAAQGTVTALTAELDAERAKTAALEAQVADLNVALEAATKPAGT
jgi:hypothetical protein